ncbi:ABC transporter substrate-binding protein [Roseiarcaceae bacterium H3SJ34-1]|uniref:ABC transporter substrate-binding protein n=1 Tax=Terripilifer ovatus TaxID=3032367 RepID=UPI003AB97BD3|nr:ABC transporter substrate-binding protein [Roseiarcaceae bacterium H3SJ34-1]
MRKSILRKAGRPGSGLGLAALLCVALAGPGHALDQVNAAASGTSSDVGSFIAMKKGYFRDEGLDVKQTVFDSGIKMIAPLGTGDLDVAVGSATAALYNAVARGIGVKIVASNSNAPPGYGHNVLIIRKELVDSGRYKKPTDIKGLKVAMPSQGSSATAMMYSYLTMIGLKFSDIEPVYLSYPNQVAALANGNIDLGLTAEPQASQAIKASGAIRITADDVMEPNHEASVTIYGDTFIKKRPDVAQRFMRAYLRGQRFYNDALKDGHLAGPNADEVIAILTEMTSIKDPQVYRSIAPQGAEPNGTLNIPSLKVDLAFYREQGWIEGNVTVEQAVDSSFAEKAAKELGPYVRKK